MEASKALVDEPDEEVKQKAEELKQQMGIYKQKTLDSNQVGKEKMDKIQEMLSKSTKTVLLTGAGIMPMLQEKGTEHLPKYPNKTHMQIAQLLKREVIHHVITSNVDGLHRQSGIPLHKLTELNGNCRTEVCLKCGQQYFRDFDTRHMDYYLGILNTKRHCDKGNIKCQDGILTDLKCNYAEDNFVIDGEPLEIIKDSDVVISCGFMFHKFECLKPENLQAQLIVVNDIEDTHKDWSEVSLIRKPPFFIGRLADRFQIKIPKYIHHKWMKVVKFLQRDGKPALTVHQVTKDGEPNSLFSQIEINGKLANDRDLEDQGKHTQEYQFNIKDLVHNRPELCIQLPVEVIDKSETIWMDMQYDPGDDKVKASWINVFCLDKEFKFIQKLKTAMIYKKTYGRDQEALKVADSIGGRARSKSHSRERSLSGKSRSRSKSGRKSNRSRRGSTNSAVGTQREEVLQEMRGRQMGDQNTQQEEEKKEES